MEATKENPTQTTEPPKTVKFYKKELISNRLALPNGRAVAFEQIGSTDTGVLATADPGLIAELDKAVAARRGGVVQITEQQYQDLKKNLPVVRSPLRSLDAQSIRQILSTRPNQERSAAAAAAAIKQEPSAPMEVPKGLVTVSSRRKLAQLQAKQQEQAAAA